MKILFRSKIFLLIFFAIPLLATLLISYFVFDQIPHVQDSIAQLFQAKVFASGRLYETSHPLKEFFDYTHIINNGRWYSQYPPGHALFLMIGVLLGIPWAINPLLGALSVLIVFFLGRELHDKKTGLLAAVLTISSPFFLFMSSEFMAHASAMFTIAVFALFFIKTIKYQKYKYAVFAGIALGLCTIIRPYTAFALSLPFLFYGFIVLFKNPKKNLPLFMITGGLVLLFIIVLFLYNQLTNGHPFKFGYTILYGDAHGLGFDKGTWGPPHTFSRGMNNLWTSIKALNLHLFGWPYLSLLPLILLLIIKKLKKWNYIIFLSFVCLALAYIFYWYHDLCFGPRFLYEALPFLVILSARSLLIIPDIISRRIKNISLRKINVVCGTILALLFMFNIVHTIPLLIKGDEPNFYWKDRGYANSYWGVDAYLSKRVQKRNIDNSIIFIRYDYPVFPFDSLLWYGSGFLNNSPDLKNNIIYARHLGAHDTLLMDFYPDRRYFIYTGKLTAGKLLELRRL